MWIAYSSSNESSGKACLARAKVPAVGIHNAKQGKGLAFTVIDSGDEEDPRPP